ncbi:hypothetical protein IscW_ISCW001422 [Ixodes scapularis]|uniref:Uncharacterized protein n=1 Tax=Ixodes scapularis TaxID=6945 RepID=B7P4M7_IXOSC|nr:hypothetical protein IscW_ISCW001422 [Ixodes scapularis]|eukprot:XP_002406258.1 hypothetical protein IscW_ISCW001422 [Ixodes scapularis]
MGHCQRGDSLQYCQSNNPLSRRCRRPADANSGAVGCHAPPTKAGTRRFARAQLPSENAGTPPFRLVRSLRTRHLAVQCTKTGPSSFSCIAPHQCRKSRRCTLQVQQSTAVLSARV